MCNQKTAHHWAVLLEPNMNTILTNLRGSIALGYVQTDFRLYSEIHIYKQICFQLHMTGVQIWQVHT
jgi:hypothetical protein